MKKAINKFFMSDKVLYAMPWIFMVSVIAYQVMANVVWAYVDDNGTFFIFDLVIDVMLVLFVFGIAISYKAHEKNIMKMLFGAILSERVVYSVYWVSTSWATDHEIMDLILSIVFALLYMIFFVNHLILGYGHKANPEQTKFNRFIALIIIIVGLVWDLWNVDKIELVILYLLDNIYEAAILIEMLCIETKVDAYKIIRENNQK